MKKFILFCLLVGLLAAQAVGNPYVLDEATALQFTNITVDDYFLSGSFDVFDGPISTLGNLPDGTYGKMSGQVGFTAYIGDTTDAGTLVTATMFAIGNAGLKGTYNGITSYFENDNNSFWSVQLFYLDAFGKEYNSGNFVEIDEDESIWLTTNYPTGGIDLSTISYIGFRVQGNMISGDYPSKSDAFHVSLVPIPGAVLLGILGLGAAGLRLRKFD